MGKLEVAMQSRLDVSVGWRIVVDQDTRFHNTTEAPFAGCNMSLCHRSPSVDVAFFTLALDTEEIAHICEDSEKKCSSPACKHPPQV